MEPSKDADSMVVKPIEYAASEYSASSEPPPAYRLRQANSVKIAKIVAFTVILSSFILGSFLLASTYLQAKSTCDQVSALDAILDKELLLETMQQDSPQSEALLSQDASDNMQDLSKDEMNKPNKKDDANPDDVENINGEHNEDDSDDIDAEMKRVHIKLPLDFDLSELAHNIMMNNQKSRMNCVVERRRTEKVDEPQAMDPFRALLNEPTKEKVTGERLSIFCETGVPKEEEPEPVVHIRRIVMPFPMHRFTPQMGPQFQPESMMPPQFQQGPRFPPQFPPQFMPQNHMSMMQPQMNMPAPPMNFQQPPMNFQPAQMNFPQQAQMNFPQQQARMPFPPPQALRFAEQQLPPVPAQSMSPPRPEVPQFRLINPEPQTPQVNIVERPQSQSVEQAAQPEFRIQLRRIQLPGQITDMFPFLRNEINKENEAPRSNVRVQQMPLAVALSKVGITPEDLTNIQRMAEEKFQEHIRELVADEDGDSSESDSTQSEEDSDMQTAAPEQEEAAAKKEVAQEIHEASSQQQSEEQNQQILALGRSNFGRSLNPVQLPAHMTENSEIHEAERSERAAFVQPR